MTIYGKISDYKKSVFSSRFAAYYSFDPAGTEWESLANALLHVYNRIEFRTSFGFFQMVLMLREMCVEAGLTREDRIIGEGHVDSTEGYYGLTRKL